MAACAAEKGAKSPQSVGFEKRSRVSGCLHTISLSDRVRGKIGLRSPLTSLPRDRLQRTPYNGYYLVHLILADDQRRGKSQNIADGAGEEATI